MSDEIGLLVRRAGATLVDVVVVPLVAFALLLVTGVMQSPEAYVDLQPLLRATGLGVSAYLLVNGWLLAARGQTLGKLITGIAIHDVTTNAPAPLWRLVCLRALFFPLLYLPLLFGMVGVLALLPLLDIAFALRGDRRALHDLAAGTCVVRRTVNPEAAAA